MKKDEMKKENTKWKMKKTVNPAKIAEVYKVAALKKNLRTRNCRRELIKTLLPEKHKENK